MVEILSNRENISFEKMTAYFDIVYRQFFFRKRGYKEISRFPVEKWIPKEALTREGLEFIIMQKGCPDDDSGQKIAMPENGVFL